MIVALGKDGNQLMLIGSLRGIATLLVTAKIQGNCKIMRIGGTQFVFVIIDQGNNKRKSLIEMYYHKSSTDIFSPISLFKSIFLS